MKSLYTVLLLLVSNTFMTFAWYGHLKLQEMKVTTHWPLILIILMSWGIAFIEYCFSIPANRMGYIGNGGPFSLAQLKVLQECITLIVFAGITSFVFGNQSFHWNHLAACFCLVMAVYFAFMK